MTLDAIVADPLREPLPDGWDAFASAAGQSALWRSEVLAPLAWYERYRPIVALVRDRSGAPCAAFCARHVSMPPGRRSFHDPRRRPPVGFLEFHLPPGITTAGYAFAPQLDVAERRAAVAAAERALGDRLGLGVRGFAYRQVAAGDVPTFARGARLTLAGSPDAVMENRWESFGSYLADLPAEHRRELTRVRRVVERDASVTVGVETSLPSGEASRLADVVRMRYKSRLRCTPPMATAFYERLCGLDGVRFITYRERSGGLLGFGALLDDGTSVRSLVWGTLDRADGGRGNLYFDHFLREVEYCIEHGRRRLVMGKSMGEIKRRFGALPVALYTTARLRGRSHG